MQPDDNYSGGAFEMILSRLMKGRHIANHRPLPTLPDDALPRVLVATLPKAGTYLISNMLSCMGFHQTYFHLNKHKMQSYEPRLLQQGVDAPRQFDAKIPVHESCHLVRSGEFAVSHFPPDEDVTTCFSGYRVVSCIRELRSQFISHANFIYTAGPRKQPKNTALLEKGLPVYIRSNGPKYLRQALNIIKWQEQSNAVLLQMEEIFSSPLESYQAMAYHLGVSVDSDKFDWDAIKNMDSLTKNTDKKVFEWTREAEDAFTEIGGPSANAAIGYRDSPHC